MSVEKAAAPPFPSQALVPHPFRLSAAAAGSGGAHSLRTRWARRRGGQRGRAAARQRQNGTRRTGAAGHTRKVGHEHQQQETPIAVSAGCAWPSHGRLDPSAAAGSDSCVGSQRPRRSPSSAPVLLRAAPSPHPFPAPLRVASRGDKDSASTHVGGGGRWECPRRRRGPTAVTAPCARLSRRHCSGTTGVHP